MNEVTHNLLKLPDIQEGEVVIAKSFYTAALAVGRRVVHNTASQFLPFLHDRNVMLPFIFLEVFQFLNIKILNQKKKKKSRKVFIQILTNCLWLQDVPYTTWNLQVAIKVFTLWYHRESFLCLSSIVEIRVFLPDIFKLKHTVAAGVNPYLG